MAVIVVVTDRGPSKRLLATRQLDLSEAAFAAIAPLKQGLAEVAITVLPPL
jgi:rare lipoprotein A (peptidoglycan hydrolase)